MDKRSFLSTLVGALVSSMFCLNRNREVLEDSLVSPLASKLRPKIVVDKTKSISKETIICKWNVTWRMNESHEEQFKMENMFRVKGMGPNYVLFKQGGIWGNEV